MKRRVQSSLWIKPSIHRSVNGRETAEVAVVSPVTTLRDRFRLLRSQKKQLALPHLLESTGFKTRSRYTDGRAQISLAR